MSSEHRDFPDYRVLGVSLFGPPPIGTVHLRWDPTLNVLYGANGAGKTSILQAISDTLSGWDRHDGHGFIHVQLRRPMDKPTDWETDGLAVEVHMLLLEANEEIWAEDAWHLVETEPADHLIDALRGIRGPDSIAPLVQRWWARMHGPAEVASSLIASATVSFEAIGVTEPEWQAYLSAYPTEDDEALRSHIAQAASVEADAVTERTLRLNPAPLFSGLLPGWVPIPLASIGQPKLIGRLPQLFDLGVLGRAAEDGLWPALDQLISASGGLLASSDNHFSLRVEATDLLELLSRDASDLAARLLGNAPRIVLKPAPPQAWTSGRTIDILAVDEPSGSLVELAALSDAQRRWVAVAIRLAVDRRSSLQAHRAILIDEPERALHQGVMPGLVHTLRSIAVEAGPIFAATHSVDLLADDASRLLHVSRDESGDATVKSLEPTDHGPLASLAQRLSVMRADILRLFRIFLIVEGAHDEAVIRQLIGGELQESRTRIVPNRGARHIMSIAEAELLVEMTDAHLVVALDNVRPDLASAFEESKKLAETGEMDAAVRVVTEVISGRRTREERLISSLAFTALRLGTWRRIHLFGFSLGDIIEYLPVDDLVPGGASSWEALRQEWSRQAPETSFKTWLRKQKRAKLTVQALERSASQLDGGTLHPDFARLATLCASI